MKVLVIPVEGPLFEEELEMKDSSARLAQLQRLVGGLIQPLPVPPALCGAVKEDTTVYVNEEGKVFDLQVNMRATDFLVPGVGLLWGDAIRGPMVLAGWDPVHGKHQELPQAARRRAQLIEREAS